MTRYLQNVLKRLIQIQAFAKQVVWTDIFSMFLLFRKTSEDKSDKSQRLVLTISVAVPYNWGLK